MAIRYTPHSKIDLKHWDICVSQSLNSLIYAESWYLNIVSPNWAALIDDDYQTVMPLPIKQKYFIPYFSQPILSQQLGIFSTKYIDEKITERFVKKIPLLPYRLNLNYNNRIPKSIEQPNYIVDLNIDYKTIAEKFNQNTRRNIEKAKKTGIVVKKYSYSNAQNIDYKKIIDDFLLFYFSTNKPYITPNKNIIFQLIEEGFYQNKLTVYFAYNFNNQPIAATLLLHSQKYLTYFLPISNHIGKRASAMFLIINDIIEQYQNTQLTLDFEGSKIATIAQFYKGFGGKLQPYFQIKRFIPS